MPEDQNCKLLQTTKNKDNKKKKKKKKKKASTSNTPPEDAGKETYSKNSSIQIIFTSVATPQCKNNPFQSCKST